MLPLSVFFRYHHSSALCYSNEEILLGTISGLSTFSSPVSCRSQRGSVRCRTAHALANRHACNQTVSFAWHVFRWQFDLYVKLAKESRHTRIAKASQYVHVT